MYQWKKFFAYLAELNGIIFSTALALCLISKNEAWIESSKTLKTIMPDWEQLILVTLKTAGDLVFPYVPLIGIIWIFCLIIGPQTFSQRTQILWKTLWIFFVFNVVLFLLGTADLFKMPFWPALTDLAVAIISQAQKIFNFNIYVGWAAGIAFIYSLTIYLKDLVSAFLNFFVGLLDRRIKAVLIDELKTDLGVRLIRTPANLIPISPSLLVLLIFIFGLGALPLLMAPSLQEYSLDYVMNILGAAIMTYGFIQLFGVCFIFLTGLFYYLGKIIFTRPRPPIVPFSK